MVSTSDDGTIKIEMKQHTNIVCGIAAKYSLPIISSMSSDNSIKLFNIETQQLLLSYNINSPTSIGTNNFKRLEKYSFT